MDFLMENRQRRSRADQIGGILWLGAGIYLCFGSMKLGLGTLHKPEPGFMPFLAGSLLAFLGLLLILRKTPKPPPQEEKTSLKKFWHRGAYTLLVSLLYALFLDFFGFIVGTFLLIFSLLKIMGTRKWHLAILIAALAVVASYFIFNVWLQINFPRGIIGIG